MRSTMYFVIGVGTGAALGMLYTPRSGADTRDLLARKAQEGTDYAKRSASQGAEYLKTQGENLKKNAAELVGRGKDAVVAPLATALDAGKQAYRDTLKQASEASA